MAPAVVGAGLALTGCGFHPLYGKQANPEVVPELASVKIDSIKDRVGQQLRNLLYTRLNPKGEPDKPKYLLETQLRESQVSLAIQKTEVATRASLNISVTYHLRDMTTGATLYASTSRATASYDLVQSEYANLAAAQDAERRSLQEVADDMTHRLAFYFTQDQATRASLATKPRTNAAQPATSFMQQGPTVGTPPANEAPGYQPPAYQPPPNQQQYQQPGYQQPAYGAAPYPQQTPYPQPPQQAPSQQPPNAQPPQQQTAPSPAPAYEPDQESNYGKGGPGPLPP